MTFAPGALPVPVLLKKRIVPCVVPKEPATPATLMFPYSAEFEVVATDATTPSTDFTVTP